jgi:NhaP-type Na+/H+ or K+/H+ antiporter
MPAMKLPGLFLAAVIGFAGSWLMQQLTDPHLMRAGAAAIALACVMFGFMAGRELGREDMQR